MTSIVTRLLKLAGLNPARQLRQLKNLDKNFRKLRDLMAADYIDRNLYHNPKYKNPKRLNAFEYRVHSQYGEDGIIEEMFGRIGTTSQSFVEFGVGDGLQNNTTFLLLKNWTGYWIEGNATYVSRIEKRFQAPINNKALLGKHAFITRETIENIFEEMGVPREFDLLSIDIDGNDYWVWKSITQYQPRVEIIEYNAIFRPPLRWIMKNNPSHVWNGGFAFGASLKSLELLGERKGYALVGCSFAGANAFFVKKDLVEDKFMEPFSAENHYDPPRFYLTGTTGHTRDFSEFEID